MTGGDSLLNVAVMSTIDVSMDPADEQLHSDWDLAQVIDLTIWHRMPYFSARMLTQLNCKRWPVSSPYNIQRIVEARTKDDTRDWYFPTIVKKLHPALAERTPPDYSWSWSGIWHATADPVLLQEAHPLPPMTYLPHECTRFRVPGYDILAVSGGLLLITSSEGTLPFRRSHRLKYGSLVDSNEITYPTSPRLHSTWQRLLVCNPFTKECRELPAVGNCPHLRNPSWGHEYQGGAEAYMVAKEETNSYEVTVTLYNFACVYKSISNTWVFSPRFREPRPWYSGHFEPGAISYWGYNTACTHMDGRLYFAYVGSTLSAMYEVMDPIHRGANAGRLMLYEMEAEAGRLTLLHIYTLSKFHLPFLNRGDWRYDMGIVELMDLVECMGDLYAVIPARLHEVLTVGQKQSDRWRSQIHDCIDLGTELEYMPLVFYIAQLREDGLDHGVVRMQIPQTTPDIQTRREKLLELTKEDPLRSKNFFSCHARGSVIWVACDDDYLVSYDVLSRESKTQLIPLDSETDETLRFAYRPSFHMKP